MTRRPLSSWFFGDQEEKPTGQFVDVSADTFGKYQHCTAYEGVFYADSDFERPGGFGKPKKGAIPSPSEEDRTPFGQPRKPKEPEHVKRARWEREKQEAHALLESLAQALVPDVEALQPQWLERVVADHERDVSGYSFECQKHGDFLQIQIERKGNPTKEELGRYDWYYQPRETATTINLAGVREIKCIIGHAPDLEGEIEFHYREESVDGKGGVLGGTGFGNYKARNGYEWRVLHPKKFMASCYVGRPMYHAEKPTKKDRYEGQVIHVEDNSYHIKTRVHRAARAAKDDQIEFVGVGITLFVPAGQGKKVHSKILAALAS